MGDAAGIHTFPPSPKVSVVSQGTPYYGCNEIQIWIFIYWFKQLVASITGILFYGFCIDPIKRWCPSELNRVQLVGANNSNFINVYGRYDILTMVYKATNITGGAPPCNDISIYISYFHSTLVNSPQSMSCGVVCSCLVWPIMVFSTRAMKITTIPC